MIGIIGAMALEIEKLKEKLTNAQEEVISGVRFTRGTLFGREVVLAVCGMGKCFAAMGTEAMILRYQPEAVINVGVAGTLTEKLGIGDVAIGTSAVCHDLDTSPLGDPVGMVSGINVVYFQLETALYRRFEAICRAQGIGCRLGTIASGDQFVVDPARKKWIAETFGALACEMEGQPIAQVCYVNRTPCAILRSISDSIDGGAADYEIFKYKAAEVTNKIIEEYLKNA